MEENSNFKRKSSNNQKKNQDDKFSKINTVKEDDLNTDQELKIHDKGFKRNTIISLLIIALLVAIFGFSLSPESTLNFGNPEYPKIDNTDMNEKPRKSEEEEPKKNTKPDNKGNKQTPNTTTTQIKVSTTTAPVETQPSEANTTQTTQPTQGTTSTQSTNQSGAGGQNGGGTGTTTKAAGTNPTTPSYYDDGDTGNSMKIGKPQYPKYGQIITEIHFLKLSQDEINRRYNAASKKDGLDWTGKANAKSWLEGTKLIVASPKTIYFKSESGEEYKTHNYLWHGMYFGSEPCPVENDITCTGANTGYPNLEVINFENVNTRLVTNMGRMFEGAKKLRKVMHIERLDTRNVVAMHRMFYGCENLTELDLSGFDTSKVVNMQDMFRDCKRLKSLKFSSKFKTINVDNMSWMFSGCSSLTSLDLSSFNTKKVKSMSYMFTSCWNLKKVYVSTNWSTNLISYKSQSVFGNSLQKSALIGGVGTVCANTTQDITVARIDKAGSPGCLTLKT